MIQHDGIPNPASKRDDRELDVNNMLSNIKKHNVSSRRHRLHQILFLPSSIIIVFLALALCDVAKCLSLVADDSSLSSFGVTRRKTCILLSDEKWNTIGTELANKLSLPCYLEKIPEEEEPEFTHGLCIIGYQSTYAVALQDLQSNHAQKSSSKNRKKGQSTASSTKKKKKKKSLSQPFFIDFCPPTNSKLGKRFGGESGTDLLLKAAALKKINSDSSAFVFDLTAGFGQDSVILAQSGANVHMVERDPIVYTLLDDALRRLRLIAKSAPGEDVEESDSTLIHRASTLLKRLSLENGEAYEVCQKIRNLSMSEDETTERQPDICYLDPMFPPRTKSAAVKKNMQLLHGLLDTQAEQTSETEDSSHAAEKNLLEAAYALAKTRVVVKRPINAPPLGDNINLKPSYDVRGKVNRWDVYFVK